MLKKSCLHALCICCVLIIDSTLSEPTILIKLIGGHFVDQVAKKIKTGSTFRGTDIMWDLRVWRGQMRKDNQNLDLHLFATNLIEKRKTFFHLLNDVTREDITTLPRMPSDRLEIK